MIYMIYDDICVNCNWEDTRWQQYSTQLIWEQCGPCPVFASLYPGICLTTEEKALKTLRHGSRRMPVGKMKTEYTEHTNHQTLCLKSLKY
jgi:hypothetical protein